MKKNSVKLLIGGLLVAFGIAYLMYTGIQGSTAYYLTIEEFLEQQETFAGEGIRIAGTVADGSIRRQQDIREIHFAIQGVSGETTIPVYYKGVVPDIFRDGASVILEGKYSQEKGLFHAVTLMTSCPSKYESKLNDPATK